jgi:hypothetical protein
MPDGLAKLQQSLISRGKRAADTAPLMKQLGKELHVAYLEHFRMLEGRGNKQGWPQRHFWNREVARFTTFASDGTIAKLTVASSAYLHKIHGGRILPRRGKALAIPRSPRAYAKGSPSVSGLPLIFIPDLSHKVIGWLVEHEVYSLKGKLRNEGSLGTVHYLLVPYVDQQPMADARPPRDGIRTRLDGVVKAWLAKL